MEELIRVPSIGVLLNDSYATPRLATEPGRCGLVTNTGPRQATDGPEAIVMYEVILTYRPDFRERIADRFTNEDDAQTAAERLSGRYRDQLVRVWIRFIREVKTKQ